MKVNLNTYSVAQKVQPAFGKMQVTLRAENVINSELDAEDRKHFEHIVNACKDDELVDIKLYGDTRFFSKKPYLYAIVEDNYNNIDNCHLDSKKYNQRQFEPVMNFIQRVVNKKNERTEMLEKYYGYTYANDPEGNKVWYYQRGRTPAQIANIEYDIEDGTYYD